MRKEKLKAHPRNPQRKDEFGIEPIKSQREADRVEAYLISETVRVKGCTREQAKKRIDALRMSGALDGLHPESIIFMKTVDKFMSTHVE